jgi:alpha-L-rhamnosidase
MLRREFEIDGDVSSVRLFASAAGLYEAYINGSKAGNSVLDPGRSEYNVRVMYQSVDITDKTVKGKNVIGAMLGRGWYI